MEHDSELEVNVQYKQSTQNESLTDGANSTESNAAKTPRMRPCLAPSEFRVRSPLQNSKSHLVTKPPQ